MNKRTAAAAGLLALAASLTPSPAMADPRPTECGGVLLGHCYSHEVQWGDFDAAGVDLWTDCLHVDTWNGTFVTNEMWLLDETSPYKWIEIGYIRGGPIAGGDSSLDFRHFWAEFDGTNDDTPLASHAIGSASISTWVNFSVYKQPNNSWNLYRNGSYVGTTAMTNMLKGTQLHVGTETTNPDVSAHTRAKNAQYRNYGTNTWTMADYDADTYASKQAFGVWTNVSKDSALESWSLRQLCSGVPRPGRTQPLTEPVLALAPEAAPAWELASADEPVKKTPPTKAAITKAARDFATANGEKNPRIELVKAKRNDANTVITRGNSHLPNNDSLVVKLRGTFDGNLFPRPSGADPITGNVITLTFDTATGEVTDWTLGKSDADLAKLGTVEQVAS